MKNTLENKVKDWVNKYKYNTILTLIIFILFLICNYSSKSLDCMVYINGQRAELANKIYTQNNEQYIHIEDLVKVFQDNIYEDKISGKIIVTTYDKLEKIKKDDEIYTMRAAGNTYFNLNKILSILQKDIYISKNKLYIVNNKYIDATLKNNRTELYEKATGNVIKLLDKNAQVKIQIDENLTDLSSKVLNVKAEGNSYGYMLKDNLSYEYKMEDIATQVEKKVLVKADSKLMSSTDLTKVDMVAINMYRLSGVNILTKLDYSNNVTGKIEVFATVNNGQNSSNFDPDITTGMLNSEANRHEIIQAILESTENLAGVNIEFGNFKVSDKENFTQFIKELSAVMHANEKKVIVSVPSTQYIEITEIVRVADYAAIQPYMARSLASKTSGPISSVTYVESEIEKILNTQIDISKVILEVPAYSILWTERRGTVINAEQYTMQAMQAYLKANNIQISLDSSSGQNYINHTKGITTYKMWLEDEYSIVKKTKLAEKYNMAGVAIYRSGMELKQIYNSISINLNK